MARLFAIDRIAPIAAGFAGLAWFWAELAPQRAGFPDTDDPAVGLRFVAAHPEAWAQAGLALAVAAIALIVTVVTLGDRLAGGRQGRAPRDVSGRAVSIVGLMAAAFLLGMAAVRLAGGPMLHVRSLDEGWAETAYLVTQFVGTQLFGVGGLGLLAIWVAGVAWLGVRRRVVARSLVVLAVLPALRAVPAGALGFAPDGAWWLFMLAIPATFLWLLLLGIWPDAASAPVPAPAPAPGALPL